MSRRKTPVVERIQKHLTVNILKKNVDRDAHWIWQGPMPHSVRRKVLTKRKKPIIREGIQAPPRIVDEDGKKKAVSRILYNHFFGMEYPYHLPRAAGCDYTCVNPFHLAHPKSEFDDFEVSEIEDDQEIAELAEELSEFIGANGYSYDAIISRYGLDYSEEEIQHALKKIS